MSKLDLHRITIHAPGCQQSEENKEIKSDMENSDN